MTREGNSSIGMIELFSEPTIALNKKLMKENIQKEQFLDYPSMWNQSSCWYGKELIQYLNREEFLFSKILKDSEKTVGKTDILSIDGIYNSKTDLSKYANLHEFSLFLSEDGRRKFKDQNIIEFSTENDFMENCVLIEKIIPNKINFIKVQNWNGKKYIANDDGSHHLAAIYRQCREQGRTYQLSLNIKYESIDLNKLRSLLNKYYLIFSHEDNLYSLTNLYKKSYGLFFGDYRDLYKYNLNIQNGMKKSSHIFSLKKEFSFNKFVVKLLGGYENKFLILNNELERLYL